MIIGVCRVEMFLSSPNTLKEKRSVLKGMLTKFRNKYNVSVAEIENQDKWQRTTIAVVCVGNDSQFINKVTGQIINEFENFKDGHIISYDIELI